MREPGDHSRLKYLGTYGGQVENNNERVGRSGNVDKGRDGEAARDKTTIANCGTFYITCTVATPFCVQHSHWVYHIVGVHL